MQPNQYSYLHLLTNVFDRVDEQQHSSLMWALEFNQLTTRRLAGCIFFIFSSKPPSSGDHLRYYWGASSPDWISLPPSGLGTLPLAAVVSNHASWIWLYTTTRAIDYISVNNFVNNRNSFRVKYFSTNNFVDHIRGYGSCAPQQYVNVR